MEIPANFTEKYNSYNEHLNKTCQSILKRWNKIGFNKEEISNRTTMIFTALKDSLNDIDEGENKLVGDIEKNLLDYKHKVELLEIQLNLDDEKRTRSFTTLLDDCRYYKQVYQRLLEVKKERKSRYSSLANKQSELCAILGEKPYETTSDKPEFDLDEIEQLEKHVNELSVEKSERMNELRQMCAEKLLILDKYQLSLPASSSLNQLRSNSVDDFEHISMGLDSMNRFRLSLEKLKTRSERLVEDIDLLRDEIRLNWRKYELINPDMVDLIEDSEYNQATLDLLISESRRCHRAKMNKIGEFTEKIRTEIEVIWNELGFVDEDKTEFIDYMNPDKQLTEDLFTRHETYLAELNEIYAKRIELTNKIRNWEKIWNEYRQFEIDYSDPNRFKQKRYSPLIENKLRTKFTSDLGKLEKEILSECDRFARNEGSEFKVDGVNFASRVAQKRAEFDKWRQDCRIERQMKMETAKKGGLTPHKKGNTPSRKPVVAITNTKSAQIVKGSVAVKPKLTTQSPLRAAVTTKCPSPSVRRTVLGHLQPANVQSTSHTVAVSKSIKRRSIKSMHSILKRRSRGSTLGTADNETNGDMITPKKAPSIHHYPTPPHIRILNPNGHVIGGYSPSSSSRHSAIDSNKRARFECLDSSLIASSEASDSALFLSNLNSSFHHLSSTPV